MRAVITSPLKQIELFTKKQYKSRSRYENYRCNKSGHKGISNRFYYYRQGKHQTKTMKKVHTESKNQTHCTEINIYRYCWRNEY